MYFLVQANIKSDPDYPRIFEELETLGYEYEKFELDSTVFEVKPKAARQDVFVYGSVKLARLAKENPNLYPGSFYGGNHLYEIYAAQYGQNLLNYDAEVFEFGTPISWKENERKFIKPFKDAKIFTGRVFYGNEWNDFVNDSLVNPRTPMLTALSLVQSSSVKQVLKEARLWIVGTEIVEAVYYRFNEALPFEEAVSNEGLEFAKRMIELFQVAEAFVMDICMTLDGWKIVEVNCINSAGFYPNVDIANLLQAINDYFEIRNGSR